MPGAAGVNVNVPGIANASARYCIMEAMSYAPE